MMDLLKLKEEINKINTKNLEVLKEAISHSDCMFLLGNGGSSAICSHLSEDYTKALNKKALTFTDSAQLTCYANDYGYEAAYKTWLSHYIGLSKDPLVILISSSGNSKNILNCANYCFFNNIPYLILTGFKEENDLRKTYGNDAIVDFWVDSEDYGIVECVHQIFLHAVI